MSEQKSMMEGLLNAIRNDPEMGPKFKAMEDLDEEAKGCVQAVDLDIAFSPVLLDGCTHTDQAVEVAYRSADGRGVIKEPYQVLSEAEHKLARARFLVARGKEMQPRMAVAPPESPIIKNVSKQDKSS